MSTSLTFRFIQVWRRNADVWLKSAAASLLGSLGEPVLYLVAMGYGLGAYLGTLDGTPYIQYIAPGLILSSGMFSATYECTYGAFLRMIHLKTYDAITTTPISLDEVVAGDVLWGMSKCVLSGSIMFAACAIFGLIHSFWSLGIFLLLMCGGFLFSALAMWIASKAKTFEWFNYYLELFITPMFFFSGVFFPLNHFPQWMQIASNALPLTHAVRSARELVNGTPTSTTLFTIALLTGAGLVMFLLAVRSVKGRLVR